MASVSKLNGRISSVAGSSFITSTNASSPAAAQLRASNGACTRSSVPPVPAPSPLAAASMLGVILANPGSMPFQATAK